MGLKIFALIVLLTITATVAGLVYLLGGLPGRKARERGHPQAEAIAVAGWLGLALPVFWPLALVWAYLRTEENPAPDEVATPDDEAAAPASEEAAA